MIPARAELEHRPAQASAFSDDAPDCSYYSGLLFPDRRRPAAPELAVDPFVHDLNLDQVFESIVAKREEPDYLRYLFGSALPDEDAIAYRHDVFDDLEDPKLLDSAKRFVLAIRAARSHLDQIGQMRHRIQRKGWLLDAAAIYCKAVRGLAEEMKALEPHSRALKGFMRYLETYVCSDPFRALADDTSACKSALAAITYTMQITPGRIDIARYTGEVDYSAQVEETFERFSQGVAKDYRVTFRGWPGVDSIGAEVLDIVARLYVDEFALLDAYCQRHSEFVNGTIRKFERDLDFYLAYRDYIDPLREAGLAFCRPRVSASSKAVSAVDTFDLALASKMVSNQLGRVVLNTLELSGVERVFVVSGPNQGGKTTFARTFGQLHHLASIGCPVPGTDAQTYLFDRIFTHFEREEDVERLSGKLEDDLVRIHDILAQATPRSILIMNEIFTSTALSDARYLGTRIMERVIELDLLCVFVTFVDEIASLGDSVVSVMSTIVPDNPAQRTFRLVRAPANGLAFAMALAEKHDLTYDQLKERMGR
ncbi:MAG TPA: hypothetical protein VN886_04685 [Acidimicrobiales bacterium]|nr:hypothetical protein [Acidimicrobiales bacterium]